MAQQMEKKIIKIAENLIEVRKLREELDNKEYWIKKALREELDNKEYWIKKASQETDFIPTEGDWIHVEITLITIRISVHHKNYGGSKYWINGHWFVHPFDSNYPLHEEMLAEMRA